jgi:deoxycytidine triphosphate deaminase
MKTYYTYAYLRENGTPYYIGKGTGRRAFHKNHNVLRPSKDKILFLKTNLSEEDALKHEKYLISILDNLLNKTIGGGKGRNLLSEEHKLKISKKLKKVRHIQIITQEHKDNIKNSVKKHWDSLSEEERTKRTSNFTKPPKKIFIINGKEYIGIQSIMEEYNMSKTDVTNRIYSKSQKWSSWSPQDKGQ